MAERIASADLIIRAEVGSVRHVIDSGRVLNMTTGRYGPTEYSKALEYTFTVHEYLQGSGEAEVKGLALDAWYRYPTVAEAEASGPDNLSARDSQWEDREGIFFLGEFPSSQTHRAGRYFFGVFRGGVGEVDMYSIASKYSKRWLPATTGSSDDSGGSGARQGTTETGEREYLLDEPTALSGGASGATAQQMSAPTITLTALKAEIAAIAAEVAVGDGTEAYEKCIFLKYRNIIPFANNKATKQLEATRYFVDADTNSWSWRISDDRSTVSSGLAHRGYAGGSEDSIPGRAGRHTAYSAAWTVAVTLRTAALRSGLGGGGPLSDGTVMGGLV